MAQTHDPLTSERLWEMRQREYDSFTIPPGFTDETLNRILTAAHDRSALLDEVDRLHAALAAAQRHEAMMLRLERERLAAAWQRIASLEHENEWLRDYKGVAAEHEKAPAEAEP